MGRCIAKLFKSLIMAIQIQEHSDNKIYVNNKLVYVDMDGEWTAKVELTTNETSALQAHLRSKFRRMQPETESRCSG